MTEMEGDDERCVRISGGEISGNTAGNGGAPYIAYGDAVITDSQFTGNAAEDSGSIHDNVSEDIAGDAFEAAE